jgi:ATP-binding cassette subfamily C protein CydC
MNPRMATLAAILRLFLAERRGALIGGALLAALTALAGAGLLALSGWFITASALAGLSATAIAFDVFMPAAGIRLLALTRTAGRYGERLVTHDATLAVLARLRERLFRGWAAPEAAGRLAGRPARLLFRLTLDIDALDALYLRVLVPLAAALCVALGATLLIGLVEGTTALAFALFVLAAGLGLPALAVRAAQRPARRRTHALEVLRARVIDGVSGQTELLMAGRLAAHREACAAADRALAAADDDLNRIETGLGAALSMSGALLLAAMLVAGAGLSARAAIDAPMAALLLLLALAAFEPFAALRRGASELGRAVIAAHRTAPRLAPPLLTPPPAMPAPGLAARLDGAAFAYPGAAAPALAAVDLAIAAVGPSGAGKSTLMAALAGEMAPAAGRLAAVAGTLLTQRTTLFRDSLRDNLRLALPEADDRRLRDALAAAGLEAFLAALPRGLDTPLGEAGLGLSGGQARRLALARLFLRDTPLWLLDEPTEGLDGATARDVLARLSARAGSRTLVIATHLRREAAVADRIIRIAGGRIGGEMRRGDPGFADALDALRPD